MLTSETYHTSTSWNPGRVDSHSAGTAKIDTRLPLVVKSAQIFRASRQEGALRLEQLEQ